MPSGNKDIRLKEFERLRPALLKFANSMLRDLSLSEDIVQEAYIRLCRTDPSRPPDNFDAFMRKIVRNLCLDQIRSHKRRAQVFGPHSGEELEDVDLISPEHVLAARQDLAAVLHALDALPRTTRTILQMSRMEEKTLQQISEELAIPLSNVYRQLKSGLKICLDAKLKSDGKNPDI